ncbi:MAG: tRNA 2-thiouridine(34) synthase MnmA [Bacteroidales bacterium]
MSKGKVLMAMSGGLDSSVAAILLQQQGYELVGITMKTWDYATSGGTAKETGCCSLDSIHDARYLAVSLGFPHYVVDIREEFDKFIISDFVDQYLKGRTPNPCVLCNTHIKWAALLKRADQLGCQFIATGHYAQVRQENGRYVLSKGVDEKKDQSYVLWGLTQEMLARTLFPLGGFSKTDIRQMAADAGFEEIAGKRESYEICFIPDDDYRGFLKEKVPGLEQKVKGGLFVDAEGKVLGEHEGYPFYTIGQRKGLNIALGEPMYVKQINAATNVIVLGKKQELFSSSFLISGPNFIKFEEIPGDVPLTAKIRYKDKGHPAIIEAQADGLKINLLEDVSAITPGQSAVLYHGDDVVAGGFIDQQ